MTGVTLAGLGVAAPALAGPVPAQPSALPEFNGTVWASAYSGTTLYLGGDFTEALVGGKRYPRSRLAAVNAATGTLLSWAPSADGQVRALAVSSGSVYAAGAFGAIGGVKRDSLARLSASSGALGSTFKHSISGQPLTVAVANGRVYLGGSITAVDGQPRARLAAFDADSGALDTMWKPSADDRVESIVATPGRIYLGGKFHKINNSTGSARIAAVTPSAGVIDPGFRVRASVVALAIVLGPGGLYAAHGGMGGQLVAYDTSGAERWAITVDGDGQAVTVLDDVVYLGGHFDRVCHTERTGAGGACLDGSVARAKLAAATVTGQLLPWTANGNGVSGVLTLNASTGLGAVAAGGAFTTINGVNRKRFVQFR